MTAALIDGEAAAAALRAAVKAAVPHLPGQPTLAVILVGDDPASKVYVRGKVRDAAETGMRSLEVRLPGDATQEEVIARVRALCADGEVDGVLVQLPLPRHIDEQAVLHALDPDRDVDGLTEISAGRLLLGKPGLRPCTPTGAVLLARSVTPNLAGAHCVVIGRSILVGKPTALLFQAENCTVTMAHSHTRDLPSLCRSADILVAAIGRPLFVGGDWIKEGAIVIDVGINRVPAKTPGKTKLVGDVDTAAAIARARAITPVPGGVGPMTRACLMRNTLLAACARRGWAAPPGL